MMSMKAETWGFGGVATPQPFVGFLDLCEGPLLQAEVVT
jgi:hypothetical protein